MTVEIRGRHRDRVIEEIAGVLGHYELQHPKAKISLYRQNSVSVRIRIIDPGFARMNPIERNNAIWDLFDDPEHRLSDTAQSHITMLLLLTPSEMKKSFGNIEFEDPIPSRF